MLDEKTLWKFGGHDPMDACETALHEVENLLDAAATDARDISDLPTPTRNAVELLIRAIRELSVAVASRR